MATKKKAKAQAKKVIVKKKTSSVLTKKNTSVSNSSKKLQILQEELELLQEKSLKSIKIIKNKHKIALAQEISNREELVKKNISTTKKFKEKTNSIFENYKKETIEKEAALSLQLKNTLSQNKQIESDLKIAYDQVEEQHKKIHTVQKNLVKATHKIKHHDNLIKEQSKKILELNENLGSSLNQITKLNSDILNSTNQLNVTEQENKNQLHLLKENHQIAINQVEIENKEILKNKQDYIEKIETQNKLNAKDLTNQINSFENEQKTLRKDLDELKKSKEKESLIHEGNLKELSLKQEEELQIKKSLYEEQLRIQEEDTTLLRNNFLKENEVLKQDLITKDNKYLDLENEQKVIIDKAVVELEEKNILLKENNLRNKNLELEKIALEEETKSLNQQNLVQQSHLKKEIEKLEHNLSQICIPLEKQIEVLNTNNEILKQKLVQVETNFHNELYQMRQKLQTQTDLAARLLNTEQKSNKQLTSDTIQLKKELKLSFNSVEYEKNEAIKIKSNYLNQVESIQNKNESLENLIKATKSKLNEAETLNKDLTKDNDAQSVKLESSQDEFNSRIQELEHQHKLVTQDNDKVAFQFKEVQKKLEQKIEENLTKANNLQDSLSKAFKKIEETQIVNSSLTSKLSQTKDSEIKKDFLIDKSRNQIDELGLAINNRDTSILDHKVQIDEQQTKIGMQSERLKQLEKVVYDYKEELQETLTKLTNEKQTNLNLNNNVNDRNGQIQTLKKEQEILDNKNKSLYQEIDLAEMREKNSKQEGQILIHLVDAISELPTLSEKLAMLSNRFIANTKVQRVTAWRLLEDQTLEFVAGLTAEGDLKHFSGKKIPISKTFFGGIIANQKSTILNMENETESLDVPHEWFTKENGKKEVLTTCLCVPLGIAGETSGLLLLASNDNTIFGDEQKRMAQNIAPLFAIALRFEKNIIETVHSHRHEELLMKIYKSRQKDFINLNNYYYSIIDKSRSEINKLISKDTNNTNSSNLLKELEQAMMLPEIRHQDFENLSQGILQWTHSLCERAKVKQDLTYKIDITIKDLDTIIETIGTYSNFLIWYLQEAIENVIKHAKAKNLNISLSFVENKFRLTVLDDGEGLLRTGGDPTQGFEVMKAMAEMMSAKIEMGRDENGYGVKLILVQK